MKKVVLAILILTTVHPAVSAPPPELDSAVTAWAAPSTVSRYQFSLFDLNNDGDPDAVVHLTDPDSCGNGGCPLLVFQKTSSGYTFVTNSGLVRQPVYVLDADNTGWSTLAAVVGFGNAAGMVPILYKEQEKGYRSKLYLVAQIDLTTAMTKQALVFEEAQ